MLFLASEPFISLNIWTSIFTLCNLLIVFFLMKKFLFKPVKAMMEKRRQEVSQLYSQAEEAKSAAEESRSLYEGKLEAADQEAAAIVSVLLQERLGVPAYLHITEPTTPLSPDNYESLTADLARQGRCERCQACAGLRAAFCRTDSLLY